MAVGRVLAGIGVGIVTLLLVAVIVIELLAFEFSAIIGLPIGLLAGLLLAVIAVAGFDDLSGPLRWVVAGVSGIGYGIIVALGLSYVNIADLGTTQTLGVGLAIGLLTAVGTAVSDRRSDRA